MTLSGSTPSPNALWLKVVLNFLSWNFNYSCAEAVAIELILGTFRGGGFSGAVPSEGHALRQMHHGRSV
eukprot:3329740-Pyramimonas_sp.AAC.1